MARTEKTGFNYTRLDVDFWSDLKIRKAKRKNPLAPYVYLRIVAIVIKEGYYLKVDKDLLFVIAEDLGIDEETAMECLDILTSEEVNLLDHSCYEKSGVLTSHGIQNQYNAQCDATKRKAKIDQNSPYCLIISSEKFGVYRENSEEITRNESIQGVSSELIPLNTDKLRKNATKKRKEKESKENYSSSCCSSLPSEQAEEEEQQQQDFFEIFFFKNFSEPSVEFRDKFLPWNNTGDRHWDQWDYTTRLAAVKQWEQRPARPRFRQSYFLEMWRKVVDRMHEIGSPPEIIRDALADELRWQEDLDGIRQEDLDGIRVTGYRLFCTKRLYDYIEKQHLPDFKPILWKYLSKNNRVNMNYTAYDEYNE